MSDEATPDLSPDVSVEVDAAGEIDAEVGADDGLSEDEAEELEYRQKLAAAQGKDPPKTVKRRAKKDEDVGEESEDESADQESDEDAPATKDTKKETAEKAAAKVRKLKVNGREIDFDFSDEKAVEREVQKGLASTENFQKAARIEKNSQAFVESLRDPSNVFKVLEDPRLLGPDKAREAAERYLVDKVKYESMDDDERNHFEEKRELERFRAQEQENSIKAAQQKKEQLKQQFIQHHLPKFKAALEQGDVPISNWTVAQMGRYMNIAQKNGLRNITAQDVLPYVKRDWEGHLRQTFGNMPGDRLLQVLGEEAADKIRKEDLARYDREGGEPKPRAAAPVNGGKKKAEKVYTSREEMMSDLLGDMAAKV